MKIEKIISGAQTGADRGGLQAALALGIPTGGWCPKGRRAEDGVIPKHFSALEETPSSDYPERTEWNVRDSDATILFTWGDSFSPGSRLTKKMADRHKKPCCTINLRSTDDTQAVECILEFLKSVSAKVLNIAGSRESKAPGIQAKTERVLVMALTSYWIPVDPRTGIPKTPSD